MTDDHMRRSLHEVSPILPQLIRDYIAEMKLHLEYLTRQPELPLEEKLHFLRETRHTYGRTALVLSGGGALGVFHLVSLRHWVTFDSDACCSPPLMCCFKRIHVMQKLCWRGTPETPHLAARIWFLVSIVACAGRCQGAVRQWAAAEGPVRQQCGLHQCVAGCLCVPFMLIPLVTHPPFSITYFFGLHVADCWPPVSCSLFHYCDAQ